MNWRNGQTCIRERAIPCWQFRQKDKTPIPRWLVGVVEPVDDKGTGALKILWPGGSGAELILDEGNWIVCHEEESKDSGLCISVYADAEFRQLFRLTPEIAEGPPR